jgi:hypothetical protein
MNVMGLSTIGAAALSWSLVFISGSEAWLSHFTPAPIEGRAIAPQTVIAGALTIIDWRIVKRTDCKGQNARVWVGESGFHLAEAYRPTGLPTSNDWKTYHIETEIPDLAPPGKLTLSIEGFYQCPGSQRQDFTLGPVHMEVVG